MELKKEVMALTHLRLVQPMRQDVETLGGVRQPRHQLPARVGSSSSSSSSSSVDVAQSKIMIKKKENEHRREFVSIGSSESVI